MIAERIQFRYIQMPCCQHLLCWISPRLPSYCPECGKHVYPEVKGGVLVDDMSASLRYNDEIIGKIVL